MILEPITKPDSVCKCCQGSAELFGVCDFNKNCEERNGLLLKPSGIPVYYYRCSNCGFVFTELMDIAAEEDFTSLIYNDDYIKVDPDYAKLRPENMADLVANTFKGHESSISILDFGGGSGRLTENLKARGFADVDIYDPFTPAYATRPTKTYNLILCFEVFEHVTDPLGLVKDIRACLDPRRGFVLFSTATQPDNIQTIRTAWWYISPRNGHLSIHSQASLRLILENNGLNLASANACMHCAYAAIPDFAQAIFNQSPS